MSHLALQRLVVRLLYDPALVDQVYADPDRALAGFDLTPAERRFVVAPDRRAYATDPHRRSRSLTELLREFPGASSLVAASAGGLAVLDRFFSSSLFHAAIEHRGSLARAFGDYLIALAETTEGDARLASLARLEQAIARVRRAPIGAPNPPGPATMADPWLVVSSHTALVHLPAGTLEQHSAVLAAITRDGRDPVAAIAGDRLELPPAPAAGADGHDEPLLIEGVAGNAGEEREIRVAPVTAELAELLLAAAPPGAPSSTLRALACRLGAEPGEDVELIADLVGQGVLVTTAPPTGRHASC